MNWQTYLNHKSCPSAHHKGIWGNGCITPLVLKLGTRLGSASRPGCVTPPGESPWYPLNSGLGVPQNQSGCLEKKNLLFLPGNEPWLLTHAAHRLVNTTKLSLHPLTIMLTHSIFMTRLPHTLTEEQLWEWRYKIKAIISSSCGPAWTLHFTQEWKWSTLHFTTLSIFYHAHF